MVEATIGTARSSSFGTAQNPLKADSAAGVGGIVTDSARKPIDSVDRTDVFGSLGPEHPSPPPREGAARNGHLVIALAGHADSLDHAAATALHPAMQVIGRAVKIEGHVSVVRNGVAVALNNGDVFRDHGERLAFSRIR